MFETVNVLLLKFSILLSISSYANETQEWLSTQNEKSFLENRGQMTKSEGNAITNVLFKTEAPKFKHLDNLQTNCYTKLYFNILNVQLFFSFFVNTRV
jgi:hypothetical protein